MYIKIKLRNSASCWLLLCKSVNVPFSLKWFLLPYFISHVLEHSNEMPYLLLLWVLLWIQTVMFWGCNDSRWLGMGYHHQKLCYFFDKNKHSCNLCMNVWNLLLILMYVMVFQCFTQLNAHILYSVSCFAVWQRCEILQANVS